MLSEHRNYAQYSRWQTLRGRRQRRRRVRANERPPSDVRSHHSWRIAGCRSPLTSV